MKEDEKVESMKAQQSQALAAINADLAQAREQLNELRSYISKQTLVQQQLIGQLQALNELSKKESDQQAPVEENSESK